MIRKKLTASLREKIKAQPHKFKQSDLSGDALTYLKRVRSLKKARKKKKDGAVKIMETPIAHNTDIYKIIEAAAKSVGMTPHEFSIKNKDAVNDYITGEKLYYIREADYLKHDVSKARKVFINGKQIDKAKAKYAITRLRNKMLSLADIYNVVNIEHYYDGKNNIHINIPLPSEYKNIDNGDDLLYFLDSNFPDITYYQRGSSSKDQTPNEKK